MHWVNSNSNFKMPTQYENQPDMKYRYRDIQKDSLRCFLLYIPMQIIRHIQYLSTLKRDDINKDEVFTYIMTKVKLLRFGVRMLVANDLHICQIVRELNMIINFFGPFLQSCNLKDDISKIILTIENEAQRTADLDDSTLSIEAQQIKINQDTYKQGLPDQFTKQYEGLLARQDEEWIAYE